MEDLGIERISPEEIEFRSFAIITEELGDMPLEPGTELIVKRCIHASADFDYARSLYFSPGAVEAGLSALMGGARVVTDTQMAYAGINKRALSRLGGEVFCFMADEDVAREAKEKGVTRASLCMDRAASLPGPVILAIGNAPTALIRLRELIDQGQISPALIIGVPVGFVNVVASKELIMASPVPCIVARGRKGGSSIAACIVNALLYQLTARPS